MSTPPDFYFFQAILSDCSVKPITAKNTTVLEILSHGLSDSQMVSDTFSINLVVIIDF